jgi:DNA-binding PadR family transcriptional regulator
MSIPKFGFSITVIQLIETDRTEYKLESVKFGSTVFITKKSMSLCIENLKKLEEENMIYLEQMEKTLQKKKKIYSLSRKRKRLHSLRHPK